MTRLAAAWKVAAEWESFGSIHSLMFHRVKWAGLVEDGDLEVADVVVNGEMDLEDEVCGFGLVDEVVVAPGGERLIHGVVGDAAVLVVKIAGVGEEGGFGLGDLDGDGGVGGGWGLGAGGYADEQCGGEDDAVSFVDGSHRIAFLLSLLLSRVNRINPYPLMTVPTNQIESPRCLHI